MRTIEPTLNPRLSAAMKSSSVAATNAFYVGTYRGLVQHVAELAYLNKDVLFFFRGQHLDYKSKAGGSTYYPSIYRDDYLPQHELRHRFEILDEAARRLLQRFEDEGIEGRTELRRKRYIQWSILQHYGVCRSPLLDLTHSLRVACSFAQLDNPQERGYVVILGLPYLTGRISVNSEHDLVNVRLLSICPPAAVRPYFQDGYLAGTEYVTTEYDSKTELDFRNRLVAKFEIPTGRDFWGAGFSAIPRAVLFPAGDQVEKLCASIEVSLRGELLPGELGTFITEWSMLESSLLERARELASRNLSPREAIRTLEHSGQIDESLAHQLDRLRIFRNDVVHRPDKVEADSVPAFTEEVRRAREAVDS